MSDGTPRLRSASDGSPSEVEGSPSGVGLDLRILTPGLSEEEIAAVTSVVAASIEAQRATNADGHESAAAAGARRWRRSVGPLAGAPPFSGAR